MTDTGLPNWLPAGMSAPVTDDSGPAPQRRQWRFWPGLAAKTALRALTDAIWPPSCALCESATAAHHALCPSCWLRLAFIARPYCERLGTPFAIDIGGPLLSPAAIANPPVFARARAVCRFDEAARTLVHRLKYGDRLDLAEFMGRLMVQAGRELLPQADAIVPIPLHRLRYWARKYNQARLLADVVARETGRPVAPGWLERRKATASQVGLTRNERALNVAGAFRVPQASRAAVAGKRILLIDDTITTGATANAAASALLRAGAASVDVLSFARVVAEGA